MMLGSRQQAALKASRIGRQVRRREGLSLLLLLPLATTAVLSRSPLNGSVAFDDRSYWSPALGPVQGSSLTVLRNNQKCEIWFNELLARDAVNISRGRDAVRRAFNERNLSLFLGFSTGREYSP